MTSRDLPTRFAITSQVESLLEETIAGRTLAVVGPLAESARLMTFLRRVAEVVPLPAPSRRLLESGPIANTLAELDRVLRSPPRPLLRALAKVGPPSHVTIYAGSYPTVDWCGPYRVLGSRAGLPAEIESKDIQFSLLPTESVPPHIRCSSTDALDKCISLLAHKSLVIHAARLKRTASMSSSATRYLAVGLSRTRCQAVLRGLSASDVFISDFVPGLPITVYGYVASNAVALSGAYETLTEIDPRSGRISVPGVRGARLSRTPIKLIRRSAKALIRDLARLIGYRGGFCIDGVLHKRRYIVFDVNLRSCAGARRFLADLDLSTPTPIIDLVIRESAIQDAKQLIRCLKQLDDGESPKPHELTLWDNLEPRTQAEWHATPGRVLFTDIAG